MNKKKSPNRSAVIDISSNYVGMTISQIQKNEISVLESLQYPISLIHDVYDTGNISFENMRALLDILTKFSEPIDMYGVGKVRLISYSVMREAKNSAFVSDQIRVQNNLSLEVLDTNREKAYVFNEVIEALKKAAVKGKTLLAFVGNGSIGLVVYDGEQIIQSQEVHIGASKLYDMLSGLKRDEEKYFMIVEEFVNSLLSALSLCDDVEQVVLSGTRLPEICELLEISKASAIAEIDFAKIKELYDSIKNKSPQNLSVKFDIHEEDASVLHSALFIYMCIINLCKIKTVYASPSSTIPDAITKQLLFPKEKSNFMDFVRSSAISCAKRMAEKFGYNPDNSGIVYDAASKVFDSMRKIHGLDKSNKAILEIASILYACPALCNLEKTPAAIFDFIKNIDAFGMTKAEMLKIAFVASSSIGYYPFEQIPEYRGLSQMEQLTVTKLAAIFRLSISLGLSRQRKLGNIKVSLKNNTLTLRATAKSSTGLEKWAFAEHSDFFKAVFGVSPELVINNI